ncbi:hypothetical protein ScPMuIL_005081, partial [Solemya velum]
KIPVAPLHPIPAFEEPFSRVIIDCVGPLPKTKSGNGYLLTIMCASTRFPEAIPLRNIKAPNIVKALVKFFTLVGLPKAVQSDQGSNFMSDGGVQDVGLDCGVKLRNSDVLANLDKKLCHLSEKERNELKDLILEYKHLFPDTPGKTDAIYHDVDVGDAPPVKQHPHRVNPLKEEHLKKEIQYMLDNDIIEPSKSEWSSPCVLVPKPDKTYRFCTDFRKVNSV